MIVKISRSHVAVTSQESSCRGRPETPWYFDSSPCKNRSDTWYHMMQSQAIAAAEAKVAGQAGQRCDGESRGWQWCAILDLTATETAKDPSMKGRKAWVCPNTWITSCDFRLKHVRKCQWSVIVNCLLNGGHRPPMDGGCQEDSGERSLDAIMNLSWRFAKMSVPGLVDKFQFLACRFLLGLENYDLSKQSETLYIFHLSRLNLNLQ